MSYLADTSMVERLRQPSALDQQWFDVVQAGLVGICPVIEAELMRGAKSKADRDQLRRTLRSLFTWHPIPVSAWRFVERTQDALIDIGHHRGPSIADLLVAATAEAWDLVVLHVDRDFDTIAGVTGVKARRVDQP
jgi:predicted nucleic acid-binding protein